MATHAAAPVAPNEVRGDFNGDGRADLAIGIPNGDGGLGAVVVLFGSADGLATTRSQYWTMDSPGVAGPRGAPGDRFGAAVATGDFNGDGFADLAIGAPGHSGVLVLYGSANGLQAAGSQYLPALGQFGGFALAAGDFNRRGFDDLAVGDPFASVAARAGAGAVEVHYGSRHGVSDVGRGTAQRFTEASLGIPGVVPGLDDNFGLSLATGDFSGDGTQDLAIGIPGSAGYYGPGATVVLDGSGSGLRTSGSKFLHSFDNRGSGGFALAAGDFNGDGFDDLAIGDPTVGTSSGDAGAIEIHYGSPRGLTKAVAGSAQVLAELNPGMPGPPTAAEDRFGSALAVGDFNGDGIADLAVGIPGKSAAIVLYGSRRGIGTTRAQFLQGVGPQITSQYSQSWVALGAGDFRGDGHSDLVIGEPFTDATQPAAGVIEEHDGSASGLIDIAPGTAPTFSETTPGMAGPAPGAHDNFGFALAVRG